MLGPFRVITQRPDIDHLGESELCAESAAEQPVRQIGYTGQGRYDNIRTQFKAADFKHNFLLPSLEIREKICHTLYVRILGEF